MRMAKRAPKRRPPKNVAESLPADWTWYANGPLKGCGLMRERQWTWAWDDASTLYLLDLNGTPIVDRRCPEEVVGVAAADNGDAIVAISRFGHVWWLDNSLEPQVEIECPFDPLAVAVDPYGQYAVVSSQQGKNLVLTCGGSKVAQFETNRPLKHLAFIPSVGSIVGSAEHGLVVCYDSSGRHEWTTTFWSNVGSIALDGDGQTVLLAAFGHGLVRLDCNGVKEGVYRYDHAPCLVATDFEGERILAASLDGFLTTMTYDGVIRAEKPLDQKPIAIALDALSRYAIVAFANGELAYIRLAEFFAGSVELPSALPLASTQSAPVGPQPRWQTRVGESRDEVAAAVLGPVPQSDGVALYSSSRTLRVFDGAGQLAHESEAIIGVGRVLQANETWLTAASDSAIAAFDPAANRSQLCTLPMHEISHVQMYPTFGETLAVEACEHVSRFAFPDRPRWACRMDAKVESAAVRRDGSAAFACDDRNLVIYDGNGKASGSFRAKRPEPMQVVGMDDIWASIGMESQTVRGHEPNGSLLWAVRLQWTPWNLRRLGAFILTTCAEGQAAVFDANGTVVAQSAESRERARYFLHADGFIARIFHIEQTLMATTIDGKLFWRFVADQPIANYAAGAGGVWAFIGRLLTYVPFANGTDLKGQ